MQLAATSPVVRKHGEHPIDEQQIDPRALKILRQLDEAGFEAYLVGGCIRDLLLGKQPKDFDIATNARPEQIASIFRNCRLIGRRFRLAHIHFGRYIIEVATFRAPPEREARTDSYGSVLEDNHYGTLDDDVVRRDFTINALYYDSKNDEIRDYVARWMTSTAASSALSAIPWRVTPKTRCACCAPPASPPNSTCRLKPILKPPSSPVATTCAPSPPPASLTKYKNSL